MLSAWHWDLAAGSEAVFAREKPFKVAFDAERDCSMQDWPHLFHLGGARVGNEF